MAIFLLFFYSTLAAIGVSHSFVMKKSLKFNVGVRFMLAIILCLPFKAYSAASDGEACDLVSGRTCASVFARARTFNFARARTFVLACDEAYAFPTAVAFNL
jgi:hypothetical protein